MCDKMYKMFEALDVHDRIQQKLDALEVYDSTRGTLKSS